MPSSIATLDDSHFRTEVDAYANAIMNTMLATDTMLDKIREEQSHDCICMQLTLFCQEGWPNRNKLSGGLKPYHSVSTKLSIQDSVLM